MSSASDQKLFCDVCSAFQCSFDEFVGEEVVSPSYSSTQVIYFKQILLSGGGDLTVACQAPLTMGFPKQEYWSGLPFPSPGDFPDTWIETASQTDISRRAARFFNIEQPGKSSAK